MGMEWESFSRHAGWDEDGARQNQAGWGWRPPTSAPARPIAIPKYKSLCPWDDQLELGNWTHNFFFKENQESTNNLITLLSFLVYLNAIKSKNAWFYWIGGGRKKRSNAPPAQLMFPTMDNKIHVNLHHQENLQAWKS